MGKTIEATLGHHQQSLQRVLVPCVATVVVVNVVVNVLVVFAFVVVVIVAVVVRVFVFVDVVVFKVVVVVIVVTVAVVFVVFGGCEVVDTLWRLVVLATVKPLFKAFVRVY